MKQKCSFILKASLALVLALVMLFGTIATSIAAVVDDDFADTGADVDLVDTGVAPATPIAIYGDVVGTWDDPATNGIQFDSSGYAYFVAGATQNYYFKLYETTWSVDLKPESWNGSAHVDKQVTVGDSSASTALQDYNTTKSFYFSATSGKAYRFSLESHSTDNNANRATFKIALLSDLDTTATVNNDYLACGATTTVGNTSSGGSGNYLHSYAVKVGAADGTDVTETVLVGTTFTAPSVESETTYYVTHTLTDSKTGFTITSSPVTITVAPPAAASVSLAAAPSSGTIYAQHTPVTYTATATSPVGGATYDFKVGGETVQNTTSSTYTTTFDSAGTKSVTVTVKAVGHADVTSSAVSTTVTALPTVYFNWNKNGGNTYNPTMTYDATASAAKSNHIVYKLDQTWYGSSTYDIKIHDGSDRFKTNAGSNITDSLPLSGSGYATQTTGSAWVVLETNTSITSSETGKYTFYWDYTDSKLFVEYPHKVTFNSHGGSAVASQIIDYGADATVPSDPTKSGYTFLGWKTEDNGNAAFTFNNITANGTAHAKWEEIKAGVSIKVYSNGSIGTSGGNITIDGEDGSADGTNTVQVGVDTHVMAVSTTPKTGYTFTGWQKTGDADKIEHIGIYTDAECTTEYTPGSATTTVYIKSDGTTGITNADVTIQAHFQKVHYLSLYNTTTYDRGRWIVVGAPPQQVKVTGANGVTKTYKYKAGTEAERGEDSDHGETDLSNTTNKHIVNTNDTFYYEGNLLQYYAGDKIELVYSSLASSDTISSVSYNNDIRYTTEPEDDNLYKERVYKAEGYWIIPEGGTAEDREPDPECDDEWEFDYEKEHCLYATPYYYVAPHKTTIEHVISSEGGYLASINDETHTVTFTAGDQNYLNIDIELAMKKQIFFSDYDNTVISHVNADDYYDIGEDISPGIDDHPTNCLTIKAKGDDGQTNTITAANIKLYYCNVNGEYINPTTGKKVKKENRVEITDPEVATITVNISEGTSIANSGDTDSTAYIYFGGTMPATDVYVDLNLTVSYTLTLKSKILSDTAGKTAFGQVANLYLGTNHEYLKNDACTTSTTTGPETCNAGSSIALRVTEITSGYMFVGWFTGNSSGPNLDSQPLSTSETFSYKPTATTYIWAVGTRDLYINGAAELFNVTGDWNAGGTGKNLKMKFDPNQGTAGVYYYEITETVYKATTTGYDTPENTGEWVTPEDNSAETDAAKGYKESSGYYYWMSRADSVHGNAFFQILDTDTFENDTKSVWAGIDTYKTDATTTTGVTIGKALPRGYSDGTARLKDGQGFISFSETANEGFSYPIRIYYDPNGATDAAKVYAKATPIYPHIYISNGYKMEDPDAQPSNVTFTIGTDTTNVVTNEYHADGTVVGKAKYKGNGWVPGTKKGSIEHGNGGEGRINDYIIQERNTTLHLKKSVTDATNYKVSNFLVYNITKDSVKAYPATRDGSTANYTCDITTHDAESMYIVPIVEYIGSAEKMTVIVDATQVDTTQWGDLISCYAWYSDDSGDAYGKYPGQLMVPSDDGLSWKATFPVKKPSDTTKEIVGITFANYVNASSDPKTWLDDSGVMGTVTTDGEAGTGNIIPTYNLLVRTGVNKDGVVYNYGKTNFKAQTYDYREPIAFYKNKPTGSSSSVLTFALKQGDGDVIGWTHTDLVTSNIKDYIGHATWPVDFEYLTDSTGKKYADLNGYILPDKPTTSFYIVAKGMVSYKNNAMTYNFWSGANYQTPTGSNPSGKGGFGTIVYKDYSGYSSNNLEMKYAVQWYVYDASGNYITNVLSAGFADQSLSKPGTYTVIAKRLTDLGYAVEGRSAAICYDVPRSCYNDSGSGDSLIPNADSSTFNCYRFTGQWYQDNEYKNAKVYAKVGIMTDNGEDIADSSSAAYGSASVSVNNTLCTVPGHDGTDTDEDGVDYGYTTVTDGDKGAITLTATSGNFIGWYHYNVKNQLELDTTEASFRPSYSADSTYIALYKAKVNYRYQYTGREGGIKYYNVPASSDDNLDNMSADEIADGNKVKKDSTHSERVLANNPTGAGISIFKKTINFNGTLVPETMFNNDLEYVLTVNNSSQSVESYSVTAIYNTDDNTFDNIAVSKQYNQAIDLTKENGGTPVTNLWSGHRFIGWYEYNTNTDAYGNLLSTQANYGLVCTKAQTIRAVYTGDGTGLNGPVGGDAWEVFIDDYGPTYEKTSSTSGDVYCDAIVRVRKNNSNLTTIADGGRVGMLIVDDNGTNETIKTENLGKYAAALSASNGTSGNVSVTVGDEKKTLKITNLFSTSVNSFGRVDLAAKYGYANVTDQKYHIYAYYFVGGDATNKDNYIFSNTTGYASGTYS